MRLNKPALVLMCGLWLPTMILGEELLTGPAPGLDIWLSSRCPSASSLSGPIYFRIEDSSTGQVDDLLGDAVSQAAKIDQGGQATHAQAPGFLLQMAGSATSPEYLLPSCAVMAISNSTPEDWCKDQDSAFKDQGFCTNKASHITHLLNSPRGASRRFGTRAPSFYAEIELIPSPDSVGLLPRLFTLYYPGAIHDVKKFKSDKPRDLSLTVAATTPGGGPALTSLLVVLKGLVPLQEMIVRQPEVEQAVENQILDNVEPPLWIVVSAMPKKAPNVDKGTHFHPVNITASVREVGDPSKFQRIAEAVSDTYWLKLVR